MTDPRPFKIQVFVAEGRPDGLRLIEKSNWVGLGIVCPRGSYARVKKREEFGRSGVYILAGPEDDDRPRIYVGEGETVRTRLDEHYVSKDFWQQAIVFTTTGTPRNKAEITYLEARLLELARQHKRCQLKNKQQSQRPGLSEADRAEMEGYVDELLSLLPVLGIYVFEPAETASPDQHLYCLKVKECDATGFETSTGFTVLKGSLARAEPTRSLRDYFPNYVKKRKQLIEDGVLLKDAAGYRLAQDHRFNSPSQASTIFAGRSSSGLDDWKDREGLSIKQNRAKAASE